MNKSFADLFQYAITLFVFKCERFLMPFKEIIQHASHEFYKWYKNNCIHENCNNEIHNNDSQKVYLWFLKDSFLLCTFCSAVTCGDVDNEYMPKTFPTWEEQRNNFAFVEDKEEHV